MRHVLLLIAGLTVLVGGCYRQAGGPQTQAKLDDRNMFGETPLWVSELSLQFSGGGTFQIQRSAAGDVLRSLGAQPLTPFYDRARPRRWPDLRL